MRPENAAKVLGDYYNRRLGGALVVRSGRWEVLKTGVAPTGEMVNETSNALFALKRPI